MMRNLAIEMFATGRIDVKNTKYLPLAIKGMESG